MNACQVRTGSARRSARGLAALGLAALLGCGGGGGDGGDDDWLFPLWVPTDVAIRDLDGDGRADLLTLAQLASSRSQREGRLAVRFQLAGGGFSAASSYVVETYPWRLAIADVDGDGALDVVVGDPDAGAVTWLRQEPGSGGRLLAPVRLDTAAAYGVAVAELDGDGAADVVATDTTARLVLLPQDAASAGDFEPAVDVPLPGSADSVAAGDLDGDGLEDLAVGYATPVGPGLVDRTLAILWQEAGGGLSAAQGLVTRRGLNVGRLNIADYDGDGAPDVVAYLLPQSADYRAEVLAFVLPGAGDAAVRETVLDGVRGVDDAALGDLNGDGRLDAAVAGSYPVGSPSTVESRLNLFFQSAAGSLQDAGSQLLPLAVTRIAAGDVDGDGNHDLALLAEDARVLVMLQTGAGVGEFLPPQIVP